MTSVELTAESLSSCDCVAIAKDHDGFDYEFSHQNVSLIGDSCGRYRDSSKKVWSTLILGPIKVFLSDFVPVVLTPA
ncbi:hypothetical protein Q6D67_08080 [Haliea sp. E1-2-M8]|uniref:hypothetical protein n=1 Tax=Haliea sp. E1-2-M8 TaxID=3064706 RepID=UPI0027215C7C|nr:hypothetical protein [Haliea sp. E1-2-M8]MDO8861657.1 hypothetical protein [Haliea sp. E1-2-M8]